MAYAEKLVKSWRACWKRPDGNWDKLSGFATKKAAEDYAEDQESAIRNHRWTDPRLGQQTVEEWANQWYAALDLEPASMDYYRSMLENHILPEWGDRPLSSLADAELEVAAWEKRLVAERSTTTARKARGVLSTTLGDAVPHILLRNPAVRRRARGKVAERRKAARPTKEEAWITPLQVLHLAERAALLAGRDDEFVLTVTKAYTGLRWSELVGLERSKVRTTQLFVDWQLYQLNDGSMIRKEPKDGSVRALDVPPFLALLLSRQIKQPPRTTAEKPTCDCVRGRDHRLLEAENPAEGARYLRTYGHPPSVHAFRGRNGAPHWHRSGFETWIFKPATSGWFPKKSPTPARPVPVDGTPGSGVPVRGRNAAGRAASCWTSVESALTPHGLRHSHKTWMLEDGINDQLQDERLGHVDSSVQAVYSHITDRMREHLIESLTARWLDALDTFAASRATSPVGVLNDLLTARTNQDHSRSAPDRAVRPLSAKRKRGA